jgi:predicted GTPase
MIAILLGKTSCGKSAFINSLIGFELLEEDDKPSTMNIFAIRNKPK